MNKYSGLTVFAAIVLSLVALTYATAAPPVGTAKARGDYNTPFWAQSAGRSIRHARDYSSGYRRYARRAPSVEPRIARNEATGMGQNITNAKTQLAEVRKATADKEVLASLDAIEKHLSDAAKAHAQMDQMCKMDMIDGAGTMKCCEDVDAALAKALAEHDKLMEKLGVESP